MKICSLCIHFVCNLCIKNKCVRNVQAECVKCPAGFYCAGLVDADTGHVSGPATPTLCPIGHYCPQGRKQ